MPDNRVQAGGVPESELGSLGYPTEMIRAAILMAIAGGSRQAREIGDRLTADFGFARSGRGGIHQQLYHLARGGLLHARRCRQDDGRLSHLRYDLTASGDQALAAWITDLALLRTKLTEWSERYGNDDV